MNNKHYTCCDVYLYLHYLFIAFFCLHHVGVPYILVIRRCFEF